MYYGLLTVAVIMFGVQFLFNERYRKESGSGSGAAFFLTCVSSAAGLVCLLIINRFTIAFTPFTLLMATLCAINSILYMVCSLKSLAYINLSLYSIFAMLGGMLLPFVVGILFYEEPLTLGKGICIVLIVCALLFTRQKGERKKGTLYYAGVFALNGMSGVISKIFQSAPCEKTDAASYSIWAAIVTVAISGLVLLGMHKHLKKPTVNAVLYTLGYGSINKVANYFLIVALAVLPASVQYPFVTGGTMIVSTAISVIMRQKPSKWEILSVVLSFLGILALVLIP